MTCDAVVASAAEYALGILPSPERSAVAAHILRCPACREEVATLQSIGEQLADLVPGTEPPLGFDRRVMAQIGMAMKPARQKFRVLVTLAAAAALAFATTLGGVLTAHNSNHHGRPALASAVVYSGGHAVGEAYVYPGQPPWFVMTVSGAHVSGDVECLLVDASGTRSPVGWFNLTGGKGSWGSPWPSTPERMRGVLLEDAKGNVIASGAF
jgi:hypothetical protein